MKLKFLALLAVLCLVGCAKDVRIQRASSLLNVKTQVATKEFQAAKEPAAKLAVAEEYFKNASEFTQAMDDYMHGRDPAKRDQD